MPVCHISQAISGISLQLLPSPTPIRITKENPGARRFRLNPFNLFLQIKLHYRTTIDHLLMLSCDYENDAFARNTATLVILDWQGNGELLHIKCKSYRVVYKLNRCRASLYVTGTHFTNDFSITIQIRWKFHLALIQLLVIISRQNLAHATTAQLSCHVPNIVAITILLFGWEQNEISITFELWWKNC